MSAKARAQQRAQARSRRNQAARARQPVTPQPVDPVRLRRRVELNAVEAEKRRRIANVEEWARGERSAIMARYQKGST